MSTKVKVFPVPTKQPRLKVVTIPSSCPGCGQSFDESSSLRELGLVLASLDCHVGESGGVEYDSNLETVVEGQRATGYQCVNCDRVVAGTSGEY